MLYHMKRRTSVKFFANICMPCSMFSQVVFPQNFRTHLHSSLLITLLGPNVPCKQGFQCSLSDFIFDFFDMIKIGDNGNQIHTSHPLTILYPKVHGRSLLECWSVHTLFFGEHFEISYEVSYSVCDYTARFPPNDTISWNCYWNEILFSPQVPWQGACSGPSAIRLISSRVNNRPARHQHQHQDRRHAFHPCHNS